MHKFSGVFTAIITPFRAGHVDFDSLKKLIRSQLDAGIQGFVVNGTTGESPTLNEDERWAILSFVQSEVAHQVPIIMGTGSFSTAVTVDQTQKAERAGAAGALVVVPYYNKPPQAGLVEHFKTIASNSHLPIMLYNVPGRTVTGLALESIAQLAKIPHIVGIKEATGDLEFGKKILAEVTSEFLVASGDDFTFLNLAELGGAGVISVLSHIIPAECRRMMDEARAGKHVSREFEKYRPLTELLFQESNPIPVKSALKLMGVIQSDELRLPLIRASEKLTVSLSKELRKLGII